MLNTHTDCVSLTTVRTFNNKGRFLSSNQAFPFSCLDLNTSRTSSLVKPEVSTHSEDLNSVISTVCNYDISIGRYGQASGLVENSRTLLHALLLADALDKVALGVEYLQVHVLQVSDGDMFLAVHSNPSRAAELALVAPLSAKLEKKRAIFVEHLHAKIPRIRHQYFVLLGYRHVPRATELAVGVSVASEVGDRLAFGVEDLNSVVVSISDDQSVLRVQREATGAFELTGSRSP